MLLIDWKVTTVNASRVPTFRPHLTAERYILSPDLMWLCCNPNFRLDVFVTLSMFDSNTVSFHKRLEAMRGDPRKWLEVVSILMPLQEHTFISIRRLMLERATFTSWSPLMKHGNGNSLPSHVPDALPGRGRGGDGLGTFPKCFRDSGDGKCFWGRVARCTHAVPVSINFKFSRFPSPYLSPYPFRCNIVLHRTGLPSAAPLLRGYAKVETLTISERNEFIITALTQDIDFICTGKVTSSKIEKMMMFCCLL
ncbi:BnaC01g23140D [Brassica napus]|uniref:BnaC01g23140D protein n=1 Tax=Brassica napus TaxID=3708 RepID=A0A078FTM1_BRANA|nr:BnaC01g23140D [Brassica napus]